MILLLNAPVLSITRILFNHKKCQLPNVLSQCFTVPHAPVMIFAYHAKLGTFYKTINALNAHNLWIIVYNVQTAQNVKFVMLIS